MDKQTESRSQFEAWFKNKIIETPDFVFNKFSETEGEYIVTEEDNIDLYLHIQEMYMAWRASRDSLVAELPEKHFDDGSDKQVCILAGQFKSGIDKCAESLRGIGIRIKGEGV